MATALSFVDAVQSPNLGRLKAAPKHFKQDPEISESLVIEAIVQEMKDRVLAALPVAIKDNVIYGPFLSSHAREWIQEHPSLAANVPVRRQDNLVQKMIRETAGNVIQKLVEDATLDEAAKTTAIHNLQVAINQVLRSNLEELDTSNIIYISPDKKCSPQMLRNTVKVVQNKVDEGVLSEEEAIIGVFWLLGGYSQEEIKKGGRKKNGLKVGRWRASIRREKPIQSFEDLAGYDLTELAKKIHESLIWARDFIDEKITKRIHPLIHKEISEGNLPGDVTFPSINQTLRGEDLFTLLATIYDKESETDDANDAQILANYTLVHWVFNRRRTELNHTHQIDEIDEQIEQEMFEMEPEPVPEPVPEPDPTEAETKQKKKKRPKNRFVSNKSKKVLKYNETERKFEETESNYDARCRVLKVSEEYADISEEKRLVYLDKMGQKSIPSSVIKHFNPGRTNRDPDQMPDEVRTRLIAWNVTSQELRENPRLKEMYIKSLEEMGMKLGLVPCQVEDELAHEHFPKLTLSGKNKQGINVEILLVPIDTHQFADPTSSWFNHDRLEEMRDLETLLVAIPYSGSRVSHDVGQKRIKEIKEERNHCRKARKDYLATRKAA